MKARIWLGVLVTMLGALLLAIHVSRPALADGPWYVAPGGDDGGECMTPGAPCATIEGAIGKATPGGTVYVAASTYTGTVWIGKDIQLLGGWDASFSAQTGVSTIDGLGTWQGISVSSGIAATVERFTVQNCSASWGAGIRNSGVLTLTSSTVSNNATTGHGSGGGILNGGTLVLYDSVVSGNTASFGGGVDNGGDLTLNDSAISGNGATGTPGDNYGGGGIFNDYGTVTLNNSVINENMASARLGGGLDNHHGTVTLNDSTVKGNSAFPSSSGGIYSGGTLVLNNSTVSGNKGVGVISWIGSAHLHNCTVSHNTDVGLSNSDGWGSTTTLQNTLVAGNTSGSGPDCAGTFDSLGHNLVGDTTGCTLNSTTGDLTDVAANLGELIGVPGEPMYHPLLVGSPAIDAGNPISCANHVGDLLSADQRGAARVGRCDIGAYEYTVPGPAASVQAIGGTPQHAAPSYPFGTPLQAAVLDGMGSPVSGVTVTLSGPDSGPSGTFVDSGTFTTTDVTGESGTASAATFTANGLEGDYVVTATIGGVVTPTHFVLSNLRWYVAPGGDDGADCQTPATACATIGGVLADDAFVEGDVVLVATGTYTGTGSQVVLIDKSATLVGGWNPSFTAQVGMSIIDGQGTRTGIEMRRVFGPVDAAVERFIVRSGLYGIRTNLSCVLTVTNSTVTGNTRGGIYNDNAALDLSNSTVSGNATGDDGGGIHNNRADLTLKNCTISDNTAGGSGGGINNLYGTVTMQNTIVAGNSASSGPDCAGDVGSSGYSLVGDTSGCTYSSATGDLTGTDAGLGPLIGGHGFSLYHPLVQGSPAIDAGNPAGCTDHAGNPLVADQRGISRVGRCDMGAYERTAPGTAAHVFAYSGDLQRAPPLRVFGVPMEAVVLDGIGSPVDGVTVTWTAPGSGPSVIFADSSAFTTTAVTDGTGIATAASFRANEFAGSYTVSAAAGGVVTEAHFSLSNVAWYVRRGGSDGNDCQSPATACATIDGALAKVGFVAGDAVYVGAGTYTGSGDQVVLLDKDVNLSGGWDADFTVQEGDSIVDGEDARRCMTVDSDVSAAVERLVFQHGRADEGGGILNDGVLVLNQCVVRENYAPDPASEGGAGIKNTGVLTLSESVVSDNVSAEWGGGIFNVWGTLSIQNSVIHGNAARSGGGIVDEYGTISLENSTVSGNLGGGIGTNGILTVTNCTLSGNTSTEGAGLINSGSTTLINTTIAGNSGNRGGGIYLSAGTIVLRNSLVAGNTGPGSPDCYGGSGAYGTISSAGYNLVGDTTGCNYTPGTGDVTDVDAGLGALQGVPGYHPLLPGSPAIDGGDPAGCTDGLGAGLDFDQRGMPRIGRCDIGAYEFGFDASKTAKGAYTPGGLLEYVIALDNVSDEDVTGLVVSDTLPASLTYVPGSYSASGGTGGESDGVITWQGTVLAHESTTIRYQVTLDEAVPGCRYVSNRAAIRAGARHGFGREARGMTPCGVCDLSKSGNNPVIPAGPGGSWDSDDVWGPAVVKHDGWYYMWYTGDDGANPSRIGLATSGDGVFWAKEPSNPVLWPTESWEAQGIRAGAVIYDQGIYKMWYTGYDEEWVGRIGYAESANGVVWSKYTYNPVLSIGSSDSWDGEDVSSPTVLKQGDTYHMWYTGYDGVVARIGHATSENGTGWGKDSSNPVLDIGAPGSWDWLDVYSPSVVKYNDAYLLWYSGETLPEAWQTGYALSTGLHDWTRRGVAVFEGAPGSFDTYSADHVAVVPRDAGFALWYSGHDGDRYTIGHAVASDCSRSSIPMPPHVIYLPLVARQLGPEPCQAYYTDRFDDPTSGWPVSDNSSRRYAYVGGQYQIWVKAPSTSWFVTPGAKVTDFTLAVSARRTSGTRGSYGVIFGISEDWSGFYEILVDMDYYSIWQYNNGNWESVKSWARSRHINTGTDWNRIKVIRNGPHIEFYVNGQHLTTVYDNSLLGLRRVGLVAYAHSSGPLDARFDDFALYPASCGPSAAGVGFEMGLHEARQAPEGMEVERLP